MNRMSSIAAIAALAAGGLLALPAQAACASGPMAGGMMQGAPGEAMRAEMERHRDEMMQSRLARLADRLEIKASQQGPWQKFSTALSDAEHAMAPPRGVDGARDKAQARPDATAIARMHADHAARHAQALAKLADATAELEAALGPDQRKVLDEVAQQMARRHFGHGDGPGTHGEMHRMHGPMHDMDGEECEGPADHDHEYGHGDRHEGPGGTTH